MTQKLDLEEVNFQSSKKLKYRIYSSPTSEQLESWWLRIRILRKNVGFQLVGQTQMLNSLLMGLITGGHVLLQGPPGVGKTTALKTLCDLLRCKFAIVHKTPDFIGANLVVINELDRCDDSFRRSLLNVMQEKEVVIGNEHFYLDLPFVVFCTINPREDGRIPLLNTELDRFMLHYRVNHPSSCEEFEILSKNLGQKEVFSKSIEHVLDAKDLLEIQRLVLSLQFDDSLKQRMVKTMEWVRQQQQNEVWSGFSTRSTLNWARAACANAFLKERTNVELEDLGEVMPVVFSHLLPQEYQTSEATSQYIGSMQEIVYS